MSRQQRCLPHYGFCAFFNFISTCNVANVSKDNSLFIHTIGKMLSTQIMCVFTKQIEIEKKKKQVYKHTHILE